MEKAQHTVNGGGVRVKRVPANTLKSAFLRQRRGGAAAHRDTSSSRPRPHMRHLVASECAAVKCMEGGPLVVDLVVKFVVLHAELRADWGRA
jgi:hypothetical protein